MRIEETTYVHLDSELYYTIHNRAYALIENRYRSHRDRLEMAEAIVDLVREYAPIIMTQAQAQASAEAVIVPAVLQMWQERGPDGSQEGF